MMKRIALAAAVAILVATLGACAADAGNGTDGTGTTDGVSSSRLAAGLYDMENGTVQAVGTLAHEDLEGGFWAIVGGTGGDTDAVIAVISNSDEFLGEIEPLEGKTVVVTGTRLEGASIRMAGPEIVMDSIEEISDTGGAAD